VTSSPDVEPKPLLVTMGVSGAGKSVVGVAVAERLRVPFADGDDLHPPANLAKMRAGEALDDADRRPWLDEVGAWLAEHDASGGVISCSALRRIYRDQLRSHAPRVVFVHLHGDREEIERRQEGRSGHFMPSSLLSSQFATLEPLAPEEGGLVVDIEQSVEQSVEEIVSSAVG
jgi:gluconokinase